MNTRNKYILTIFAASVVSIFSPEQIEAGFPLTGADGNSIVQSPTVPESVTFAGNKIDLDRIDMYERLDRELTAMTYTHGNTLLLFKRANRYFPEIIPILKKNGVPEDIIYLACIESTLNPRAYSGAKAAGLWQFMPTTAKQYGLEVNEYVDERYNTEKAT
ncbi:MAG: transglycosylase SLT domain-containing protein, partial [Lachnospiraceae bacterium]|nr:transglycosylase SLT domain-containing protein [Lachnospiraceae bacterium]